MKLKKLKLILYFAIIIQATTFAQLPDSLSHYLQIAAENNPGLKADFLAYNAALQKIPQAGAWQDPQLEMGFFLQPMEIIDGRQIAEFKLMQMFPWFGTRKAARTEMQHMAKMTFEKFRETRDNLYLEVYTQWFSLCRLQQQLNNNCKNKELLLQLEELSLRKFASPTSNNSSMGMEKGANARMRESAKGSAGMSNMNMGGATTSPNTNSQLSTLNSQLSMTSSPGMSDVLRIRLEINEIDNNIESLLSELKAEKVKFNVLLNRSAKSEIQIPETFEQLPFLFDTTSAMEKIESQSPMLGMINEEALAYKAKAEMDRKMSYPMFGIGLQYMLINKKPAATDAHSGMETMNTMNGKDMIMPMLSVSIPIYRNKYKAQQRESQFQQQASREKYDNTLNLMEAELYRAKSELDNAERKIILLKKQEDLAQTTYNLMIQEFATGKTGLTDVIQFQRQLLDYQLKKAEAVANYNTVVASIQRLISFKDKEQ